MEIKNKKEELANLKLLCSDMKYNEAKDLASRLLIEYPNDLDILMITGENEFLNGNLENSIKIYNDIIKVSSKLIEPYIKLTAIYSQQKKYKNAIEIALEGLSIHEENLILHRNLIISLIHEKKFSDAFEKIKLVEDINNYDEVPAAFGCYINDQLELNYKFKYLNSPLNYLRQYNVSNLFKDQKFLKDLSSFIEKIPKTWEPKTQTTKNGYQSENNLFFEYKENKLLNIVIEILSKCINDYRGHYINSNDLFIKDFPNEFNLVGWGVDLRNSGYQGSHNHRDSWLSGVLYLKIPKNLTVDEGNIEFSTHGYGLPIIKEKNIRKKSFKPFSGALILFPSSLFHKTMPFQSKENRVCIAFDIRRN